MTLGVDGSWRREVEMTRDGKFKRKVRARMRETGENYVAALASLRPPVSAPDGRGKEDVAMVAKRPEQEELIRKSVAEVLRADYPVQVGESPEGEPFVLVIVDDPEAAAGSAGKQLASLQKAVAVALGDPGVSVSFSVPLDEMACSFCGKKKAEVELLLAGPSVNICSGCVDSSAKIVAEIRNEKPGSVAT